MGSHLHYLCTLVSIIDFVLPVLEDVNRAAAAEDIRDPNNSRGVIKVEPASPSADTVQRSAQPTGSGGAFHSRQRRLSQECEGGGGAGSPSSATRRQTISGSLSTSIPTASTPSTSTPVRRQTSDFNSLSRSGRQRKQSDAISDVSRSPSDANRSNDASCSLSDFNWSQQSGTLRSYSEIRKPRQSNDDINLRRSAANDSGGSDMALIRDERRKSTRSLGRSDSYRKAKPLLSPAEQRKNNRKSAADVGTLDISSINLEDKKTTGNAESGVGKKEPKATNFFRNIRNQLSFSSLRRKSPKKSLKDDSYRRSGSDPAKEISGELSSPAAAAPSTNLSPASGSRMTSTPLGCTSVDRSTSEEPGKVTGNGSAGGRRTAAPTDGGGEVRFRTAAMKNQHQRWSFAEQANHGKTDCSMVGNYSFLLIYFRLLQCISMKHCVFDFGKVS